MTSKRQKNINDKRIGDAYHARCSGVQIPLMDITKVYRVGQQAIDDGANDIALGDAIAAFVETIRTN